MAMVVQSALSSYGLSSSFSSVSCMEEALRLFGGGVSKELFRG